MALLALLVATGAAAPRPRQALPPYGKRQQARRLRALPDPDGAEAEAGREVIVLTINGIAAGLRNTG